MNTPVPVKSALLFLEPGLVGLSAAGDSVAGGTGPASDAAEMDAVLAMSLPSAPARQSAGGLHMLVEGLFWFHPLIWWIGNRLCEERERACDESWCGRCAAIGYADGIVQDLPLLCPVAAGLRVGHCPGADLKLRVSAIVADHRDEPSPRSSDAAGAGGWGHP